MATQNNSNGLLLEASIKGKVQRIQIPEYALKYPSFNRIHDTLNRSSSEHLFDHPINTNNESYPIRLIGEQENLDQINAKTNQSNFIDLESRIVKENEAKLNIVSGREHESNEKLVNQFRFNRIRLVPSDRPTHGHLPCQFDSVPAVDDFGRRVQSQTASKYRDNRGFRFTNHVNHNPFVPYGYSNSNHK